MFVVLGRLTNTVLPLKVIADDTCNPAFVAADLLSQAEHGIDSQVVLVASSLSETMLAEVEKEVDKQAHALGRVDIVRESVAKSLIVKTQGTDIAMEFSNDYAPEHLILHLRDAPAWVDHVKNAGSVFVGPYSPERQVVLFMRHTPSVDRMTVVAETMLRARTTPFPQMDMHASSAASIHSLSRST